MKITITDKKEFDVKYLKANCGVRYWEDGTVNGEEDEDGTIPCREDDGWCPLIELETGRIVNWTQGVTASVHYKICDAGIYELLDANKGLISKIDGYVPSMMSPKDNGFGDYVIMDIDENGMIQDWEVDLTPFFEDGE